MILKVIIQKIKTHYKEIVAQLLVHAILFIFYSYGQDHIYPYGQDNPRIINATKFFFFLNYAVASLIINYLYCISRNNAKLV